MKYSPGPLGEKRCAAREPRAADADGRRRRSSRRRGRSHRRGRAECRASSCRRCVAEKDDAVGEAHPVHVHVPATREAAEDRRDGAGPEVLRGRWQIAGIAAFGHGERAGREPKRNGDCNCCNGDSGETGCHGFPFPRHGGNCCLNRPFGGRPLGAIRPSGRPGRALKDRSFGVRPENLLQRLHDFALCGVCPSAVEQRLHQVAVARSGVPELGERRLHGRALAPRRARPARGRSACARARPGCAGSRAGARPPAGSGSRPTITRSPRSISSWRRKLASAISRWG